MQHCIAIVFFSLHNMNISSFALHSLKQHESLSLAGKEAILFVSWHMKSCELFSAAEI